MKLIILSAFWVAIIILTLSNVLAQQPQQKAIRKDCIKPLFPDNQALADSIQQYLRYIDNVEIPIIAIQKSGDTTHYFISAFHATYSIKLNPPTAVILVNNREVLFYEGRGSISKTAPACYNYVMKKYSRLLRVDKLNRRQGRPPSYKYQGFIYDPIGGDISITKQGQIRSKPTRYFPFIKHG